MFLNVDHGVNSQFSWVLTLGGFHRKKAASTYEKYWSYDYPEEVAVTMYVIIRSTNM